MPSLPGVWRDTVVHLEEELRQAFDASDHRKSSTHLYLQPRVGQKYCRLYLIRQSELQLIRTPDHSLQKYSGFYNLLDRARLPVWIHFPPHTMCSYRGQLPAVKDLQEDVHYRIYDQ